MKRIKCKKCGKTWCRYFDSLITKEELPYYCPWCEKEKLDRHSPIGLRISDK